MLVLAGVFFYWVLVWMANVPPYRVQAGVFWHDDERRTAAIGVKYTPRYWNPRYWTAKSKLKALDRAKPVRHPLS